MGLVSAAVLVIDVPGRRDALRNDARPATAAGDGTALEFAAKDQLNLFGPAQSQMLANDFLEEAATAGAPVPHLGEGELGLQHRESIAIARAPVGGTEGMGQSGQPLAEEPLDLAGGEALTDLLCPLDIGTGAQAVVQGRKGDPCLGQLPLEILVPVEAELGGIGKGGGELEEERAEVPVQAVAVLDIDHGRGIDDPRNRAAGTEVFADRAGHAHLLLRHPDEDHALGLLEAPQPLLHHVILALALLKADQLNVLTLEKVAQVGDEPLGHFARVLGGGEAMAQMPAEETSHARRAGKLGHIGIEVKPVDAFEFQDHMALLELGDGAW